jgi:hypothetical protein
MALVGNFKEKGKGSRSFARNKFFLHKRQAHYPCIKKEKHKVQLHGANEGMASRETKQILRQQKYSRILANRATSRMPKQSPETKGWNRGRLDSLGTGNRAWRLKSLKRIRKRKAGRKCLYHLWLRTQHVAQNFVHCQRYVYCALSTHSTINKEGFRPPSYYLQCLIGQHDVQTSQPVPGLAGKMLHSPLA